MWLPDCRLSLLFYIFFPLSFKQKRSSLSSRTFTESHVQLGDWITFKISVRTFFSTCRFSLKSLQTDSLPLRGNICTFVVQKKQSKSSRRENVNDVGRCTMQISTQPPFALWHEENLFLNVSTVSKYSAADQWHVLGSFSSYVHLQRVRRWNIEYKKYVR